MSSDTESLPGASLKGITAPSPKAFISYSWTSPGHQNRVRLIAERLIQDGIEVVIDLFDLKEGQDKYSFMERMVADPNISHVLVLSDQRYAEKADARKAGVGTESQIISKEIYESIGQSKFIPIVCELSEQLEPCLPVFFKTRIWIDFSSLEAENENWEKLVRALYGKPVNQKPKLGTPPAYITVDTAAPSSPALGKLATLKQALIQGRKGIKIYRRDFLSSCIAFADALRVRQRPNVDSMGMKVLEDCEKLKSVRNKITDWVLLESEIEGGEDFCEALLGLLEQLRELKSRPPEVNSWQDSWFEAQSVFVYETFLYIVAALLKTGSYAALSEIFHSYYLRPKSERYSDEKFDNFGCFWGGSESLQSILAPERQRLFSPAAELMRKQADRDDLPFSAIIEGELLVLMMSLVSEDVRWYPQTLFYASQSSFPFFIHASQHKYFKKLALVTGIVDAGALRDAVKAGQERLGVSRWYDFQLSFDSFWSRMNLDRLDSLK